METFFNVAYTWQSVLDQDAEAQVPLCVSCVCAGV